MTLSGWEVKKIHKISDYNGYRVTGSISTKKVDDSSLTLNKKDWISLNSSLSSWYHAIDSVEKVVQNIKNTNQFVIWGGGAHTEYLYQTTSFFHIYNKSNFIIIDSDPIKQGKTWRGLSVYDPSILNEIDWTNTSLIISIWLLSGIIITFLGMVGLYIGKIFDQVKGRPNYIINNKLNF